MTVLTTSNAFLGIPMPQHLAGQTSVQSFVYPGALQPSVTVSVLTSAEALLGIPMPQHLVGQTSVQSFRFPGALQPQVATAPSFIAAWASQSNLPVIGAGTF